MMLLLCFVVCLVLSFCHGMFLFGMQPALNPTERFVEASNAFSIQLYQHLASTTEGNIFICPFCVMSSLTLLLEGTDYGTSTAAELNATLRFKENRLFPDMLRPIFSNITSRIKNVSCIDVINALFVQTGFDILPSFKENAGDVYNTPVREVDFSGKSPQAVWQINEYVKQNTQNKIKRVFERTNASTRMLALTAAHFQTRISDIFADGVVLRGNFYNQGVEDKPVEVVFMDEKSSVQKLANSYDFRAMELPCFGDTNSTIKLWILLPHKIGYLMSVEDGLSTATFREVKRSFRKVLIDTSIPRIKFDYTANLNKALQNLGLSKVFSSEKSDFSNISPKKGLFLSQVMHKGVVEINDVTPNFTAEEPYQNFTILDETILAGYVPPFAANHPFLFCIVDDATDLILYMGRVNEF